MKTVAPSKNDELINTATGTIKGINDHIWKVEMMQEILHYGFKTYKKNSMGQDRGDFDIKHLP